MDPRSHPLWAENMPVTDTPTPHFLQLPFRELCSQYGFLSPAPVRPGTAPAENAPQGEPQRSEGAPLLDYLP